MVRMKDMQRLTRFVNTVLLAFVIFMAGFFAYYGVTYMVWHSIPTAMMYLWFYWLIHKERVDLYAALVYIEIEIYMVAATICLGFDYGFHLYGFSLVSLSFYMYYLGKQLGTRKANPLAISAFVIAVYLASTGYTLIRGPVYTINRNIELLFLFTNALATFLCIIGYGYLILKIVINSEQKLSDMAMTDRLTGLYNRHYMIAHLDGLPDGQREDNWVAMVDIDNFKSINDTYGHNCGDYVLVTLAGIMQRICSGAVVSRWGGEEFLFNFPNGANPSVLELLRQYVEREEFAFGGQRIPVTITIGSAYYVFPQSVDEWIQAADKKLYEGKNSGKNRVIYG